MKPVFEFKTIMNYVRVYSDRVILEPKGVKSWGADGASEILFESIEEIQFKEANFVSNGFMHFSTSDVDSSKPMTLIRAGNDKNTFVFKKSSQEVVKEVQGYVISQIENPSRTKLEGVVQGGELITHKPLPSRKESFEEYRRLTKARDWKGIFEFNNSSIDNFGTKKELGVLHTYLTEGEIVFALASGILSQTETSNSMDFGTNTWLIVLTDKRVLLLDHAMLSSSVDTQSVRHDKIQAISASQGWMFGKLTIDIGNRSILVDNSNKKDVKVFAELANDWFEFRADQSVPNQPSTSDPISELARLADMKSAGILDDDEFSAAKAKILSRI
jgi:hypothetical protein